jgi:catechol 2,3-dioxygenase-like lactoylglutathione lyase family enzyme
MTATRPELGATLDHICIHSAAPERLARFFEAGYGMRPTHDGELWRCEAPGRRLLVAPGKPNSARYFAYAYDNADALARHREALRAKSAPLAANPSPFFDERAFSLCDPDGNVVVFGLAARTMAAAEPAPARLQHLAFRTAQIEAMVAFYVDTVGLVLSDRVEDGHGKLRACFLRSDQEHHALALFAAPEARLDHHSYETSDIGRLTAWADHVTAQGTPIHWGVGRHGPGNDVFFMVKDPDDNLVEISTELEQCASDRPAGRWPHEQRTLNLWGTAILRS